MQRTAILLSLLACRGASVAVGGGGRQPLPGVWNLNDDLRYTSGQKTLRNLDVMVTQLHTQRDASERAIKQAKADEAALEQQLAETRRKTGEKFQEFTQMSEERHIFMKKMRETKKYFPNLRPITQNAANHKPSIQKAIQALADIEDSSAKATKHIGTLLARLDMKRHA
mmetsp:Transcript_27020/g.76305  ORF Transcript_27020/g.76305 Transcript_27020/m.76305 type:complete len:169 (+) Transcript_27020:86-592(+)